MAINLVNISDKNCPLRTLEMAFQRIQFSIFSGRMPPDPLGAHPFSTHLIEKISQFYILKRLDSMPVIH